MDLSSLLQANLNIDGEQRICYFRSNSSDKFVLDQIFGGRQYELKLLPQYQDMKAAIEARSALGKAPLIIDAGANIGISAIFFAITYPGSIVYAIEPEPSNFELLVENTKGLNVICVHAALSAKRGQVKVVDIGEGFWGFQTQDTEELEGSVPAITMEDVIAEQVTDDTWLLMAKIDIEGAEGSIFEGHPAWVEQVPVLIIELHDWLFPKARTSRSFMKCMAEEDDRDIVTMGENLVAIKHQI